MQQVSRRIVATPIQLSNTPGGCLPGLWGGEGTGELRRRVQRPGAEVEQRSPRNCPSDDSNGGHVGASECLVSERDCRDWERIISHLLL
jgi:hypothetical protein